MRRSALIGTALILVVVGGAQAQSTTPILISVRPRLSTVTITGGSSVPKVTISGAGFGRKPAAATLPSAGYTGYDYGNSLYFCDTSASTTSFCAGQGHGGLGDTIGLVVTKYTPRAIAFTLGNAYTKYYYPRHIYVLKAGDTFAVHIKGVACTGTVHFSRTTIPCSRSA